MATIELKDGVFHVRFRFQGRAYRRSLKTTAPSDAKGALHGVESALYRLHAGALHVPLGLDAGDFIASGGSLSLSAINATRSPMLPPGPSKHFAGNGRTEQPLTTPSAKPVPTLRQLMRSYLDNQDGKADSTVSTERIHLKHLEKSLLAKLDLPGNEVGLPDLAQHQRSRYRLVSADTVAKEMATIAQLFNRAVDDGHLAASPAARLPRLKGEAKRPPFRTIAEIKAIIERGGLTQQETIELWECLFLAPPDIAELLALVRARAHEDFAPLLHEIPAYTGMRRGEVMRLTWQDVDLERGFITARSRKQSRQSTEVTRQIDLHMELKHLLTDWRGRRPRGQFVVCRRDDLKPLDPNTANRNFRQPLLRTPWCLDAHKRWFKIGFHTYRHSFASNLAAAGIDQRIIDEWMGHTTEAMRKRYRHLFPQNRRSAIESFSLAAEPLASQNP